MIRILLIRHGKTEGNKYGRYIGITDEPLCKEGRRALEELEYGRPQRVYASPLERCLETSKILFPKIRPQVVKGLAECDFGEFENKNYKELEGNPNYQKWIDSNAMLPFPGGESREEFRIRTTEAFTQIVRKCIADKVNDVALVIHGGTIMNLMEAFAQEKRSFYDWHVDNGKGYEVEVDPEMWMEQDCKLLLKKELTGGQRTCRHYGTEQS